MKYAVVRTRLLVIQNLLLCPGMPVLVPRALTAGCTCTVSAANWRHQSAPVATDVRLMAH